MALDPEGVVSFKACEHAYRLYFGMRAIKAAEAHYDMPFVRAIQSVMPALAPEDMADKAKVAEAGADVRLSDLSQLFGFALLKHHPDLSEAEVDDLIDAIGLARASELLGDAVAASMSDGEAGEPTGNPPRASRTRKTGSRS